MKRNRRLFPHSQNLPQLNLLSPAAKALANPDAPEAEFLAQKQPHARIYRTYVRTRPLVFWEN